MKIPINEDRSVNNPEENNTESLASLSAESAVLRSYLASSKEFYEANDIPISDTTWNQDTGEFVLEFVTTRTSQAYEGLCHGGFTAMLLDSISRLSILGKKYQNDNFTDQISIKYMRKVEVGATIRVIGKIDSNDEKHASVSAYIIDVSKPTKVLAKCSLLVGEDETNDGQNKMEKKEENNNGKTLLKLSENSNMLKDYLISSQEFYTTNNIPIGDAVWNEEAGELTLDIKTSETNQGAEGVCQVGYISTLLDSIAGFPIFLESLKAGKIALSDELLVNSFEKIKVGTTIRVVGKIGSIDDRKSKSSACIVDISNPERVLARGSLTMNISK